MAQRVASLERQAIFHTPTLRLMNMQIVNPSSGVSELENPGAPASVQFSKGLHRKYTSKIKSTLRCYAQMLTKLPHTFWQPHKCNHSHFLRVFEVECESSVSLVGDNRSHYEL